MSRPLIPMLGSLALMAVLFWMLASDQPRSNELGGAPQPLMVYCAASNQSVLEAICSDYTKEFGRLIQVQYGSSQSLLAALQVSRIGDLFLPADDSFITAASDARLLDETIYLAQMHAVIAVRKGNPKRIHSFADLFREDVRVVLANPAAAAISFRTRAVLSENGLWQQLDAKTVGYRMTVVDVLNDLVLGAADATIVYDAAAHPYSQVELVTIAELRAARSNVCMGVVAGSPQRAAALHFARYCADRDAGGRHYVQQGFHVDSSAGTACRFQNASAATARKQPAGVETETEEAG